MNSILNRLLYSALLTCSLAAQAAAVRWLPADKETGADQIGFVSIVFSRGADRLAGFDLLLQFDPTVLRFVEDQSSLTPAGEANTLFLPDQLGCPGRPSDCLNWGSLRSIDGQSDEDDGTIRLSEISLAPAGEFSRQSGEFLLARLAFEGIATAVGRSTLLTFLSADFVGENGESVSVNPLPAGRVTVALPEPGTLALSCLGLLAACRELLGRKRQRRLQVLLTSA